MRGCPAARQRGSWRRAGRGGTCYERCPCVCDVTRYQGHQLLYQRGDARSDDPVLGEYRLQDLASQECVLRDYPHLGRPGLRLAQLAGECLSGHLRGGQ
eukprot:2845200-Pyramimonas_sp.AAC.1